MRGELSSRVKENALLNNNKKEAHSNGIKNKTKAPHKPIMQIEEKGEKNTICNSSKCKTFMWKTCILYFIEYLCKKLFLQCLINCLCRKVHIRVSLLLLCKSAQARTVGRMLPLMAAAFPPDWAQTALPSFSTPSRVTEESHFSSSY